MVRVAYVICNFASMWTNQLKSILISHMTTVFMGKDTLTAKCGEHAQTNIYLKNGKTRDFVLITCTSIQSTQTILSKLKHPISKLHYLKSVICWSLQ